MPTQREKAAHFLSLHRPGAPLLMPNAWDIGSAVLFASLGMEALATTSGGFANSRGRLDGAMNRHEVLAHAAELAAAVDIPVSADLENCFAHEAEGVAATITDAIAAGLAGGSVEDFTGDRADPMYEVAHAADRVRAAAEAAHGSGAGFVLTARCENYLHGRPDLDDTITRLQAYQEAGADALFAPRVDSPDDMRRVLANVDLPVSVLLLPGVPSMPELAALGVSRISVGSALAVAAYGAAVAAVTELRDSGTCNYWDLMAVGGPAVRHAFSR